MVYGQVFHHESNEEDLVNINVGGIRHKVERCILLRFPNTRVAQLLQCCSISAILELCDDYNPTEQEYYFDRSPQVFYCVLNFYRTGHFHALEELCVFCFIQEMEYWGLCVKDLEACCFDWLFERKYKKEKNLENVCDSSPEEISAASSDLTFEGTWCSDTRKFMWQTLEDPGYSRCAKGLAVLSIVIILTSIVAMFVHSMPEYRHITYTDFSVLACLEITCIIFFTVEFALRMFAAPRPWKFLRNPLNIIDLASFLPFYVILAFEGLNEKDRASLVNVEEVVQILQVMRAFRVLKLARHSEGVRAFGETLKDSHHEVCRLLLFIAVGIPFFSTLIYYIEKDDASSTMSSFSNCCWWAIVSLTTVGYGDVYPQTLAGRIVATFCILCGLLVVSVPISAIMDNFSKYFGKKNAKK
ncbi:potassium voltage-gated channel subfamily S member 3b [Misgurnus anguillicaudatus]|uniref:potassium voltage-gated channel subfamily S member 3b n=1 Tax=Misgurnus anguillicaudatus TaxID=75329 RepID=UPI003CCFBA13